MAVKEMRIWQVLVRFTTTGIQTVDKERGQVSRAEYIRQAVAFAINHGFKVKGGEL